MVFDGQFIIALIGCQDIELAGKFNGSHKLELTYGTFLEQSNHPGLKFKLEGKKSFFIVKYFNFSYWFAQFFVE